MQILQLRESRVPVRSSKLELDLEIHFKIFPIPRMLLAAVVLVPLVVFANFCFFEK